MAAKINNNRDIYTLQNQYIMKKLHWILSLSAISILSACTSSFQSSSTLSAYDDIYYSPNDKPRIPTASSSTNKPIESDGYTDDYALEEPINQGNNYSSPNSQNFDYDEYYDYGYAARLRRFHGPTIGIGYYDPYFVDPYFYNRNSAFIGTSIYDPFYQPFGGWNIGFGVGFGWNSGFGYNPYNPWGWNLGFGYNPWGWNNGFGMNNAYMAGYNQGFYNGFYGGNRYDNGYGQTGRNNVYYAPRGGGISSPYQTGSRSENTIIRGEGGKTSTPTNNASETLRPSETIGSGTSRPTTRPTTTETVRPSQPSSIPNTRPNINQATPQNARPQVPSNATAVPKENTSPTRTNTYSRPNTGGSYNQSRSPQQSTPTRTVPRSSSPSRSPSYNSTPSYNRSSGGSSGGGSRSSSPRSRSPR